MRATRALIHLDAFRRNIQAVRSRIGETCRICIPVKADAYGHGSLRIAGAGLEAGAYCLAVASVQEGAELRAGGIKAPILLLSQAMPEELPEMVRSSLIPLLSDLEFAEELAKIAVQLKAKVQVHLKVDTGMCRLGCRPEDAVFLAGAMAAMEGLVYAGTATHLSVADSPSPQDIEYTGTQLERFRAVVESMRQAGIDPGIVHAANSGGVVFHPDSRLDMVRPGILLYGYSPKAAGNTSLAACGLPVEPVMELVSNIVLIKEVKKGESVSYGRMWTAAHDTTIGTIPVGYADGFPRSLGGQAHVVIRGEARPIVGRVCMDQCLVDLGPGSQVKRWEEVSVFGGPPPGLGADVLAERTGTISYEITCNINKRVERMYCEQGIKK
ncbi:MAG: alanine racemase [Treponema sp.]|nr:alanine racemase [Treponema sp.]